ncbi:(R)-mandelonitrile lyase [Teredinibacter turnerae]|uniref:(R)-mandelonitrile lyase n=1 Tax=Teredinibacter turnerae TaxID=2426 RepID=UPI0005F803A7|nr:cupin domain-containing protein [Teredinibacter turnerae]
MKNNKVLWRIYPQLILSLIAIFSLKVWAENPSSQVLYMTGSQPTFAAGSDHFTGEVSVELLFPSNDTAKYSGAYVTFQAGSRTAWHSHPAGQHIVVLTGTAVTGTRDGEVMQVSPGEAIWCPPGVDHWHGATKKGPMKHLVVTGSKDGNNVVWKEHVTDGQYQK